MTSLRKEMPLVAEFIDDLRSAFGPGEIDGAIRAGMQGRPFFWASEGGHEIGTPLPGVQGTAAPAAGTAGAGAEAGQGDATQLARRAA